MSSLAQETEVTVKVKKDGKVVKDTTYTYDNAEEAEHALKMMELVSGEQDEIHTKEVMVFIDEDGEKTVIKENGGEEVVWVTDEDDVHKEHKKVMVIKSGDESTYEVITDGEEGDEVEVIVVKKKVKHECDHDGEHQHAHENQVEVEVKVKKKNQ